MQVPQGKEVTKLERVGMIAVVLHALIFRSAFAYPRPRCRRLITGAILQWGRHGGTEACEKSRSPDCAAR